jgi:uncharacterized alkaline shock family protein YloU
MTTPASAQPLPLADSIAGGDPASRGHLEIADRVIERIAAQAAAEVARATGTSRRLLGVSLGTQDERPDVTAHVDGDVATVDVVMSVAWPAPVAEVTEQVRARIVQRLADLADVRTAQVDIRVTALVAERRDDRRVH